MGCGRRRVRGARTWVIVFGRVPWLQHDVNKKFSGLVKYYCEILIAMIIIIIIIFQSLVIFILRLLLLLSWFNHAPKPERKPGPHARGP